MSKLSPETLLKARWIVDVVCDIPFIVTDSPREVVARFVHHEIAEHVAEIHNLVLEGHIKEPKP